MHTYLDMVIALIYTYLLLIMTFLLYCTGRRIRKDNKQIVSLSCFIGIITYTLNEGLRYGRGIDYNAYWDDYNTYLNGAEINTDIGFRLVENFLINLGLPWQCCVILMSFFFIFGAILFLKDFKSVPLSLPLFCLFSLADVENMVRWYLAYSIYLIGLHFLLRDKRSYFKYFLISAIACTFHYAFIPIPLLIILLYSYNRHICHPLISILIFFIIGLTFKTSTMLAFTDLLNFVVDGSERFGRYGGQNAEYWLTSGYSGIKTRAFPHFTEILMSCVLVYYGYKIKGNRNYLLTYNLFIIGFIIMPIANQIELLRRYDQAFYFFRAIIVSEIIYNFLLVKKKKISYASRTAIFVIMVGYIGKPFIKPFVDNPQKYLYVWNSEDLSSKKMINMWVNDAYSRNKKRVQ